MTTARNDDWSRWSEDWRRNVPPPLGPAGRRAVRRARRTVVAELLITSTLLVLLAGILLFGPDLADRIWVAALFAFFTVLAMSGWRDRRWLSEPLGETTSTYVDRYHVWCRRRLAIARAASWFLVLEGITLVPLATARLRGPSPADPDHRLVAVIVGAALFLVAVERTVRLRRRTELRLAAVRAAIVEQEGDAQPS